MIHWPDQRIIQLLGIEHPILQAPMAGVQGADLALAVARSGGLGSLPCALLTPDRMREEIQRIRSQWNGPFNLNFFCHQPPAYDSEKDKRWRAVLQKYYREFGLDPEARTPAATRNPFDEESCRIVEEFKPAVVSFHFGLPDERWLARVKASGVRILSSATTVEEAQWLEKKGCDAIIAQGSEAGGHRGSFLARDVASQVGTLALVPQVVDAVKIPVIASGGIGDARGIRAAFALGAAAVQLGSAFLLATETTISNAHRQALRSAQDDQTVLTNIFTGRPARGVINRLIRELGPISHDVPEFPHAAAALAPLRSAAEAKGQTDFSPLWAGQAIRLAREESAAEIVKRLVADVQGK
ncbi:NAD(P)H-dependent flavin oxidoreductase [Oligoflexus tunisiensis]|uniref:NAD(P)H-dependent flavin oxidoreductase n=1 Tax=Oligoflexus tunisiensis TaxID=708132 RepID=UPI000AE1382E|nr:nitronate monooxygenase [Oligoflexus tunisiensis]